MKLVKTALIAIATLGASAIAMDPCTQRVPGAAKPVTYSYINGVAISGDLKDKNMIDFPNGAATIVFKDASGKSRVGILPLDWDWAQQALVEFRQARRTNNMISLNYCVDPSAPAGWGDVYISGVNY